jgi:DNA-binding CsgD family transcriptional regulator
MRWGSPASTRVLVRVRHRWLPRGCRSRRVRAAGSRVADVRQHVLAGDPRFGQRFEGDNVTVERLGLGPAHSRVPIGRGSELSEVERFLVSPGPGRALVLCGEAGIGKSTLWEAGVELARSRGFLTLCARASEAEAQLPFAGLADLLETVDTEVLGELPAPQRHALEVAVRRAESADSPPEPFAISSGLLGVLRLLSGRGRLLVAVDDLPWLDRASAAALAFAARRLAGRDVRHLVSRRGGRASELEGVLEPAGVVRLEVVPLSFAAISRLLADRLGGSLPRRVVRQLFETSQGNPLFALELGRALVERGLPEIGVALPVPEVLDELFGSRVRALTPEVRRALLGVALSGGLSGDELAAAVDPLAIEDAQAAGVLIVDGTRVRASHPLLAAAASAQSSARERRELHLALARAVGDQVLRARHLAMATNAPDAKLAGELSVAAARAAALGAVQDAAELGRHALRLTPPGDGEYDERLLALARHLVSAGEHPRASELLTERIDGLPPGPARAAAYLLLGEGAPLSVEEEHLAHAIAESAGDPGLRAQVLARQAQVLAVHRVARIAEAEELASEALATARSAGPDAERRALVALAWAQVMRGRTIDELVERSAELPPITSSLYESSVERPAGVRFAFRGELARAREVFRRLLASAEERGEARSGAVLIGQLCEVELRAGDISQGARGLEEWDQWTALEPEASQFHTRADAVLAALRGEPERATELGAKALEASESSGVGWDRLDALRATGLAALLDREPERAAASFGAVWEYTVREGVEDPGAFPVAGDLVEALAESGRLEEATEVIGRLDRLAYEQQHPWGLATVKRAKAAVGLAEGYDDAGAQQLAEAAAAYRALGLGFDSARSLLFLGRVQRRFKKRAAARHSLEDARSAFDQLGCLGWADLASAELARVSGRRPATSGGLTASEQRVAELVASGLSNKEIAAQLFVSVYTVEAHLSNAYAKLGVRSRTQLARHLGVALRRTDRRSKFPGFSNFAIAMPGVWSPHVPIRETNEPAGFARSQRRGMAAMSAANTQRIRFADDDDVDTLRTHRGSSSQRHPGSASRPSRRSATFKASAPSRTPPQPQPDGGLHARVVPVRTWGPVAQLARPRLAGAA